MKKTDFLVFAVILFFLRFLILPVLGWHTGVDFFAVFVLVLALADRSFQEKFFLVFIVTVLFDIFSGSVFGTVSIALFLAVLLIFLAKKILLALEQSRLLSFLIAVFCYYTYAFAFFWVERLLGTFSKNEASLFFDFRNIFTLCFFSVIFLYAIVARQKRISSI